MLFHNKHPEKTEKLTPQRINLADRSCKKSPCCKS